MRVPPGKLALQTHPRLKKSEFDRLLELFTLHDDENMVDYVRLARRCLWLQAARPTHARMLLYVRLFHSCLPYGACTLSAMR